MDVECFLGAQRLICSIDRSPVRGCASKTDQGAAVKIIHYEINAARFSTIIGWRPLNLDSHSVYRIDIKASQHLRDVVTVIFGIHDKLPIQKKGVSF